MNMMEVDQKYILKLDVLGRSLTLNLNQNFNVYSQLETLKLSSLSVNHVV